MRPASVIVLGAAGGLGRRLIARGLARGHKVTAFVRSAERLAAAMPHEDISGVTIVEGDATDTDALAAAIRGHDAVVNACGTVTDGDVFVELFASILRVVESERPARFWALGGAGALTFPYRDRIAIGLPGVPAVYRPHERNWRMIEKSGLDWSLMCPGPMIAAPDGAVRPDLRVSIDVMPFVVPRWAAWAPAIALSLLMKARAPELVVTYEDVADIIVRHLAPDGPFRRHRVGVALPPGEQAGKAGWTPGGAPPR